LRLSASLLLALTFFFGVILPAHAVRVSVDFTGTVTAADPGNEFGLVVGDDITGFVTYDTDDITGVGQEDINRAMLENG